MDAPALLVSFCNQGLTPALSLLVLDARGRARWVRLPEAAARGTGCTGIARVGAGYWVLTQGWDPHVVVLGPELTALAAVPLAKVRDPHSLVQLGDRAYLVSTADNAVYSIEVRDGLPAGPEELHWRPHGAADDADAVHLNSVAVRAGRLIATMFGPRGEDGRWGDGGSLVEVGSGEILAGLAQPHSAVVLGDSVFLCESAAGEVVRFDLAAGTSAASAAMAGYVRGLAVGGADDRWVYVGQSEGRRRSRSRGTANARADLELRDATVAVIDSHRDFAQVGALRVGPYGGEVYDLLCLPAGYDDPELDRDTAKDERIAALEEVATEYADREKLRTTAA